MREWPVVSRVTVVAETPEEALEIVQGSLLPGTEYVVETKSVARAKGQGLMFGLMPLIPLWTLLEAAGVPNVPRMLLGLA